jgi:hypothetical protein
MTAEHEPRSRRSLLKLLGAATVGVLGGAATRADRASAADGGQLTLGQDNTSTAKTSITNSGAITNDGAFVVDATAADWALEGTSGQLGVVGNGFIGVMGSGDVGGFFSGNLAAISLQPQDSAGAPTSGDFSRGDMLVDANGALYLCTADGNPGTWARLGPGGGGGGVQLLSSPQRAYDSRNDANGPLAGAIPPVARTIQISSAVPQVPASASAIVGNLTITDAKGGGFATVWPSGAWPGTSNINFSPGVDIANAITVGLGPGGTVLVAASKQTHVIIDVAGYIP